MRSRVLWCLWVTDSLLWLCSRDLLLNNNFSSFISALCSTVPILMLISMSGMNSKSDLDIFKLFWKEEEMLHTCPRPNYLRPAAGIKFKMSSFCAYYFTISQFKHLCYLCSIVNKIFMWFESLLVFILSPPPKKKTGFEKESAIS